MITAYLSKTVFKDELIKAALMDYTGRSDFYIQVRPTGKPYIEGGPFFSYADSHGAAVCAVSEYEIGCDIELCRDHKKYMGVAKRFFHPEEQKLLSDHNFFEIYTAKEAYVKFTEMGIFSGMEKFSTASGKVKDVNIISFSHEDCICAAASRHESEVNIKWLY